MNVEFINKVADMIEGTHHVIEDSQPYGADYNFTEDVIPRFFCMNYETFDCGAPACIYGFACAVKGKYVDRLDSSSTMVFHLKEMFDIDINDARTIYNPVGLPMPLRDIIPEMAVAMLRKLAETGDVDWQAHRTP